MTDAALPAPVAGRSLWADAWGRLRRNKAAVAGAVYLVLMALACIVGPWFTPHEFSTIYQDYVRVPPSLSPYPQGDQIKRSLDEVTKRARLALGAWSVADGRLRAEVTSPKPIDERVVRYFDRSNAFGDSRVEATAPDRLSMTISADIREQYFLFGTDNTGRDLLTRTLIAGRVSLAIGVLAGFVAIVIGVLYGATSGFLGGRIDNAMMRFVDVLYSLPFIFFVIMLVVFFGRN